MTTTRITINGATARDILSLTASLNLGASWAEVRMLYVCGYGCKLHARQTADRTEFALIHSATYGCPLGRDEATATVGATVEGADDADLRAAYARSVEQARRDAHADPLYRLVNDSDEEMRAAHEEDMDACWRDVEAGEEFDRQVRLDVQMDWAQRCEDSREPEPYDDEIEYADESEYIYA